jgi:hypothetical protein
MRCISPKRRTTSAQSAAPSEPTKAQRPINVLRDRGEVGHVQTALARRRCLVPADAVYEWKVVEGGKRLGSGNRTRAETRPTLGKLPRLLSARTRVIRGNRRIGRCRHMHAVDTQHAGYGLTDRSVAGV